MLELLGSRLRRLAVGVLLAAVACSAPDSSGLFGPSSSSPIPSEEANPDAPSDDGAGDPPLTPPTRTDAPASAAAEGNAPVGGLSPPAASNGSGPTSPVALEPDAGAPIPPPAMADGGSPEPDEAPAPPPPAPPEPLPPEPEPEPECASLSFRGSCWYVAAQGQSCAAACATRGGFSPASPAVVGSPAQGGSLEACDAILQAFGAPAGVVNEGFREDGLGFGCHLFIDDDDTATAWWLTEPGLTPDVSDPNVRMVCGCVL